MEAQRTSSKVLLYNYSRVNKYNHINNNNNNIFNGSYLNKHIN